MKKSEDLRKQTEGIHSALLSIHNKIRSSSNTANPSLLQFTPLKTKSSSSVASSKLRTSCIILSETDFVEINNTPVKNRINMFKDYTYGLKLRKVNTARKVFLNMLSQE